MKKIFIVLLLVITIMLSCTSKVETVKNGIPLQRIASTADLTIYKIMIDGYLYIIYDGYHAGNIILAGGQGK